MKDSKEVKYRIEMVQQYLLEILKGAIEKLNIDYLDSKTDNYSLTRMPISPIVEKWVIPIHKKRELYTFTSRKVYSQDIATNLDNIGFFEEFENRIRENNLDCILPLIDGIESIECLNCGAKQNVTATTVVFSIQIQIVYRERQ